MQKLAILKIITLIKSECVIDCVFRECKMTDVYSNLMNREEMFRRSLETLWLGSRVCRGLLSNFLGVKMPLFCGHKLTYNCNLRCKMCPFWKRSNIDLSTEVEKAILRRIYDSVLVQSHLKAENPSSERT